MTKTTTPTTKMRRCIGSKTFGIEPHEAPVAEFPKQPSQKDGLGRMCKPHWRAYTNALRKAALARKALQGEEAPAEPETAQPAKPAKAKAARRSKATTPSASAGEEVAPDEGEYLVADRPAIAAEEA